MTRMTRAMPTSPEGLKSDALRAALLAVLALPKPHGPTLTQLELIMMKHGGLPGLRPNLKLAAAFGAEIATAQGPVMALLSRWADDIAAPDTPRAFLPVAAAHGLAQHIRVRGDVETCWRALQLLAADERAPVRVGTLEALISLTMREGYADELLERSGFWLDDPEREVCYGAVATALEALADPRVLPSLREPMRLPALMTRVIDVVADAPRAAQRSDGRRRVLRALSGALPHVIATVREARPWFTAECGRAEHPEVRAMLSDTLLHLADVPNAPGRVVIDELRAALEGSQKPVRDAARVRLKPGSGRGRRSRPLR